MTRILATWAAILTLGLWTAGPGLAQQPFAAAVTVNGQSVTNFQVQQRARFFALLRAPNADLEGALEALTNETLQVQAARQAGISITPDQLDEALVEFAGRANLEPQQFLEILRQNDIAPETFRDFIRNQLYWRDFVRQRFGPLARPSDEEVERALTRGDSGAVRVLLSEIALPITPETQGEVNELARNLSDTISGQAAFEQAARRYSRSATAARGGRLDYLSLGDLSPQIASQVLTLGPGEVSEPVNLGSFIGLFLLRDLDETAVAPPASLSIDYAEYLIPGGRTSEALGVARRIEDRVDTCDDLYGVAKGAPEGTLTRTVEPTASLAPDLRQELAKLDEGEVSTLLTRGGFLRFIMMCGRVAEPSEEAFAELGQQLLTQRLTSYAEGYLEELRADAIID